MTYPNWIPATWRIVPFLLLVAAAPTPATAAPVVVGSGYSVYLTSTPGGTVVPDVRFDGVVETFTRAVTLADGQPSQVGFSVHEEQVPLGNGDWMIRIVIDADADLYPTGTQVGFSFGSQPDDPLDLDGNWRLVANVVSIYADGTELARRDYLTRAQDYDQADPWQGFFISRISFGIFEAFNGQGVDRVAFEVQVSPSLPVPEPGSLALVAVALASHAARRRRPRTAACGPCHRPQPARPGAAMGRPSCPPRPAPARPMLPSA